jgi:alanine-synthesizing transaminase
MPRKASTTTRSRWSCWNSEDVLIVPGSSFNVPYRNHFRVTLLPEAPVLREVFARIDRVLDRARRAARDRRAAVA